MEFGSWPGNLEIRQVNGARLLHGEFPYGGLATIADRGRVRKERIRPGAFRYAIENTTAPTGEPIRLDLLVGHDWDKPVASRQSGTLDIREDGNAVVFDAELGIDPPSWVIDAEKAIAAGTMTGLSPGFRVPPLSVVPGAESTSPEPGNPSVSIREIAHAVLREMSIVTSAGYLDAMVELRADSEIWQPKADNRDVLRWL